ncbi:PspC domain-containing protein [Micrococcus luteus]|uniref:PspC domain-containing protein n=1 Tax=Micrococcus luteus TaxID=1270 RepID=UPI000FD648B9|nr:PspC domain-containing protein [Micrococcus luteus]
MTSTHDPFTGLGPHVAPDGAAAGETGPDGLDALPGWLRRAVLGWAVRRSPASWVGGVLGGVAERYRIDPLLARGVFVAVCMVSAGLGLLAYAAAWAVLPDADGRVQFGRLRRGEWQDATVAIGVIGAIGALNLLLGAGFTLIAPAVGGPGSLVGLGALAVLVWWLVTRWDGRAQARVAPGRAPDADQPSHAVPRPAWYVGGGPRERAAEVTDPHGFRPEWIDPATGTWRDHVHSRERRAAARLAEEAPGQPPPDRLGVRSHGREAAPRADRAGRHLRRGRPRRARRPRDQPAARCRSDPHAAGGADARGRARGDRPRHAGRSAQRPSSRHPRPGERHPRGCDGPPGRRPRGPRLTRRPSPVP